jgi:hypothetical protein
MPIPPHLQRKLQQAIGTEAGDSLVTYLDSVEAMRGDIAELRHDTERLEDRLTALINASNEKLTALIAVNNERLTGLIATTEARLEASFEKGLREQTRFFFVAWSVILAFVVGLYVR